MRTRMLLLWEYLRTSLWFVPSIMTIGAILVHIMMLDVDRRMKYEMVRGLDWVYTGGPEGARLVLSTIAGSMITVAGVAFSITIVAFSLASTQFGPRLLRNFVRDPGNQIVLGTFIATFIYCLLVLRTIRGTDENQFVPYFSVTGGVGLAILSLGVLIYFIHHVSTSIQADHIVAVVASDLKESIDEIFPERLGRNPEGKERQQKGDFLRVFEREAIPVTCSRNGYIQEVRGEQLMELARENHLVIQLLSRPGQFLVQGVEIALAWPPAAVSEAIRRAIDAAHIPGPQRTPVQDIEFAINQLVEVALRALSPGVNDPFTAITCIDRLCEAICRLFGRAFPAPHRYDDRGQLRVIAVPITHGGVLDAAFNQIRQHSRGNVAVTLRLLEALVTIAPGAVVAGVAAEVRRHADMIIRGAGDTVHEQGDRADIGERYRKLIAVLARMEKGGSAEPPAAGPARDDQEIIVPSKS